MARQRISDQDIFKAVLQLGPGTTMRTMAEHLGVSQSALHRRLHALADAGYVALNPLALLADAIDAASERTWQPVELNIGVFDGQVVVIQP